MLRITVLNTDPETTRLKLEGKLAHEWVWEAERTWKALPALHQVERLVVDLLAVSFVDDGGRRLLTEMHRAGAELIGAGPLIPSLIEEIKGAMAFREGA